ncbi:4-hydroxyphenylpyruvate dioxygenase [Metschnikowia bicuspidata var. bicuspidata NRRL YB-4993]|uniref:4-hydroxyphenylpyruvate dioxygenase n=1 Tax=Metschnikowia bicuspidata var. bicuspidata NRRL YB-4993 TaxID=869754 RepID=A0A1A0HAF6_9ASCO|nr:4-hydroxyphenylpyruvate dioxygenase [Metschnikowia bicuspidata var. bicuspidata NRRL YB-4993]OBA20858.1 4-hydroxyphenylpyruvate dioxygenase [Metschnikowia bicuspidata var. bicuspidata NRRL YB-4993]
MSLLEPDQAVPDFPQNHASDFVTEFYAIRFASSNARQMARHLELAFDFREIAYRGLETGALSVASHVLQCNDIVMEFMNPLDCPVPESRRLCILPPSSPLLSATEALLHDHPQSSAVAELCLQSPKVRKHVSLYLSHDKSVAATRQVLFDHTTASFLADFINLHGLGVCDILFKVTDVKALFQHSVENGAVPVNLPRTETDQNGSVITATIALPTADLHHTFVQVLDYTGKYLPGYGGPSTRAISSLYCGIHLQAIDHCVLNYSWNQMTPNATFYALALGFHKFWSVDDKDVSTGNTGLRLMVMTNKNGNVKIPINEPAKVKLKGQIEEFYDFYGGPGVQHVALRSTDILNDVLFLRSRGLEFNTISDEYYRILKKRLDDHQITLAESFSALRENHILVDFDPESKMERSDGSFSCFYILQIFSKPLHDRPTFFFEFIQRHEHDGFGKGTFKGLFESIEREQELRGTLGTTHSEVANQV